MLVYGHIQTFQITYASICEIRDRRFYSGTDNSQNCVKQNITKHEKPYSDNQLVFISFAFDLFGFLTP